MYVPGGKFYPFFDEPGTFVTSVDLLLLRDDGYYFDFADSTFKDTGWTTKIQALTEKTEGIWVWAAGWTIPSGNREYRALYKDNAGALYQGERILAFLPTNFSVLSVTAGGLVALSAAGIQAIWDALTSALTTAGSIGKLIVDNLNATISSRMPTYTQPTGFLATTFPTTVASPTNITAATGIAVATGGIGAGAHAAAELSAIADATLDRNMATGTDSGTDSTAVRTPRQALRVLRNKVTIAAGTLTARKEDDVTVSFTAAVATTAGNPISEVDPT